MTWFSFLDSRLGLDGREMHGSHRSVIISRYGYCMADLHRMLSSELVLTFVHFGGLFSMSDFSLETLIAFSFLVPLGGFVDLLSVLTED